MLKRSSSYCLTHPHSVPYLLPFGQKMADQAPAFRLNRESSWIWENLEKYKTSGALFDAYRAEFGIRTEDLPAAKEDFDACLHEFQKNGVVAVDSPSLDSGLSKSYSGLSEPRFGTLSIAGLSIGLFGNETYFSKELHEFLLIKKHVQTEHGRTDPEADSADSKIPQNGDPARPDQTITVTSVPPSPRPGSFVILENPELWVLDGGDVWELLFPASACIRLARVKKDGTEGVIYVRDAAPDKNLSAVRYDVFHAIRLLFLIAARSHGLFALHSVSVLYKGKAVLFSAPSGTGKSTHAAFWEKAGWGRILNGDLNLIGFEKGTAFAYGIPWCGTSGIFTKKTVPCGFITLLKRGGTNRVLSLPPDKTQLKVCQRLISPIWTKDMLLENLAFSEMFTKSVPAAELFCTPDPMAAEVLKKEVDKYLK